MEHLGDIAQLITAIAVAYNIWQTWRVRKKSRQIMTDVADVKEQTNGLNSKILELTGDAKFNEGLLQGRHEGNGK